MNPTRLNYLSMNFANGYKNEPEFRWWVYKVLNKWYMLLEKVKTKCRKPQKYKFGAQMTSDVAESKKIYDKNVNRL